MLKVFISHPYSDNPEENKKKAEQICKLLIKEGMLPISPLHLFSFSENDDARSEIMEVCYKLIDISDEVWIYGFSEGCKLEKEYAIKNNKTIKSKEETK